MYEDAPQELVHDLIAEAVFGDHPLGRPVIGTAEVISTIPRRSIAPTTRHVRARQHRRRGRRQRRARADRRARLRAVARRGATTPRRTSVRPPLRQAAAAGLPLPAQGHRAVPRVPRRAGISRSDRRRFAASLLDAILGGSASSRLFQEIREKRGMAYSVYSFVLAVHRHGADRRLPRDARGQPRRGPRDRRRADRRHRGRQRPRGGGARAKENLKGRIMLSMESTSTRMNRLGKSLITDTECSRSTASSPRSSGRGRRGRELAARAARSRAAVGRRDRPERGAVPRGARARHAGARARGMRILLNGQPPSPGWARSGRRSGRRSSRPATSSSTTVADAEAMVDFTAPRSSSATCCGRSRRGCRASSARPGGTSPRSTSAATRRRVAVFVAPNFALGAVLMMRFAREAAQHFPAAEIVELHHRQRSTRRRARRGDRRADGGRRADPLGAPAGPRRASGGDPRRPGETLTIRHDTTSREAFARASCWRSRRLASFRPASRSGSTRCSERAAR